MKTAMTAIALASLCIAAAGCDQTAINKLTAMTGQGSSTPAAVDVMNPVQPTHTDGPRGVTDQARPTHDRPNSFDSNPDTSGCRWPAEPNR